MSEQERLTLTVRTLAASTLACLAGSGKLWLSGRFYPLVPLLDACPPFPWPGDVLVLAVLIGLLLGLIVSPLSKPLGCLVVLVFTVLFVQDQSRLWPSFYEMFFWFLLLVAHRRTGGEEEASRTLMGMRFVTAAVYVWGGVQKLTIHFLHEEFPWFIRPLTDLLPAPVPFMSVIAGGAAVFEIFLGIGLLTRRFRVIALWDALLMHAVILVCIGPLRGHWNDSAWIWSLTMAARVWLLFHGAPSFRFATMFAGPVRENVPQVLAILFVGLLPVLNTLNRWDSAVSFNVYTGNVSVGVVLMDPAVVSRLPAEVGRHVTAQGEWAVLDLNAWAMQEFNAGAYPEPRVFRRVFARVNDWIEDPSARLVIVEKATWFAPKSMRVTGRGDL